MAKARRNLPPLQPENLWLATAYDASLTVIDLGDGQQQSLYTHTKEIMHEGLRGSTDELGFLFRVFEAAINHRVPTADQYLNALANISGLKVSLKKIDTKDRFSQQTKQLEQEVIEHKNAAATKDLKVLNRELKAFNEKDRPIYLGFGDGRQHMLGLAKLEMFVLDAALEDNWRLPLPIVSDRKGQLGVQPEKLRMRPAIFETLR